MFSNNWLYKFKKCNNVCKYHMYKELENMLLASFLKEQIRLQLILSWYTFDKIYNIDENVS